MKNKDKKKDEKDSEKSKDEISDYQLLRAMDLVYALHLYQNNENLLNAKEKTQEDNNQNKK